MHHLGAQKYYKMNTAFLLLFLGLSYYNFKQNQELFFNQTFGKLYIASIVSGIFLLYLWSNKHIQVMYLLKRKSKEAEQKVGIITYSNFGLSYNKMIEVPVN